jgi:hypothetical protein
MDRFKITLLFVLVLLMTPAYAQKQTAISYLKHAEADSAVALAGGQAVVFNAPNEKWTLTGIALCGKLNSSSSGLFTLEVWDTNLRTLYRTTDQASSYFGKNISWSRVDIPDLAVPQNFLIGVFGSSNIYVGANIVNNSSGRSVLISRSNNRILPWYIKYPHNNTDWMIEAVGYTSSLPPQVNLTAKTSGKDLLLQAQVSDQDGDLANAMFFVLDRKGDAVWSGQKTLNGSTVKTEMIWSGQTFKISNASESVMNVYAYNSLNATSPTAPYGAYVAPAVLRISPQSPEITVTAYFSKEEEMHALVDESGRFNYISQDLLKILDPDISYADYIKNNLSLMEFQSTLTFFKYNEASGPVMLPALRLDRSAPQHMGIRMEQIQAPSGDYHGQVIVNDQEGYTARKSATTGK